MGDPPEDFGLVQASRYLNCPPWDIEANDPTGYWRSLALDCAVAEAGARNVKKS